MHSDILTIQIQQLGQFFSSALTLKAQGGLSSTDRNGFAASS